MVIAERIAFLDSYLHQYMPSPPIPLDHRDSYTLLIAVLLSAQCTDARVNRVTPRLFQLASNPRLMAMLPINKVETIIRSLGLAPKKAEAVVKLSQILVEQYDGNVPPDMMLLEQLPGVGHKTASVVLAQAFGVPTFPVDTHIHRLAQRWRLTSGRSVIQTERDLKRLFPQQRWNALHLQIIYYAREYCPAKKCYGLSCPICSFINVGHIKPIVTKSA